MKRIGGAFTSSNFCTWGLRAKIQASLTPTCPAPKVTFPIICTPGPEKGLLYTYLRKCTQGILSVSWDQEKETDLDSGKLSIKAFMQPTTWTQSSQKWAWQMLLKKRYRMQTPWRDNSWRESIAESLKLNILKISKPTNSPIKGLTSELSGKSTEEMTTTCWAQSTQGLKLWATLTVKSSLTSQCLLSVSGRLRENTLHIFTKPTTRVGM